MWSAATRIGYYTWSAATWNIYVDLSSLVYPTADGRGHLTPGTVCVSQLNLSHNRWTWQLGSANLDYDELDPPPLDRVRSLACCMLHVLTPGMDASSADSRLSSCV